MHNHTIGCKMKLKFIQGLNPVFVQDITCQNMAGYYLTRGLRWDTSTFLNECANYTNFQVFSNTDQVAAFSLSYHKHFCLIRDIQVDRRCQNQGVGASCLAFIQQHALDNGYTEIGLKFLQKTLQSVYMKGSASLCNSRGTTSLR